MNDEARAELDRIVALEPEALTEGERDFLMARRDSLTEEQRIKFAVTEPAEAKAEKAGKGKKAGSSEEPTSPSESAK